MILRGSKPKPSAYYRRKNYRGPLVFPIGKINNSYRFKKSQVHVFHLPAFNQEAAAWSTGGGRWEAAQSGPSA
jgi:hypothetical protein